MLRRVNKETLRDQTRVHYLNLPRWSLPNQGSPPQVTGDITHMILWEATVFLDHYSKNCYTHLIRGDSADDTLRSKEAYNHFSATHGSRV